MQTKLIYLSLLFFLTLNCQILLSQSFYYELKADRESTFMPETFILNIEKKKSSFYNVVVNKIDSIRDVYRNTSNNMAFLNEKAKYPRQTASYYLFKYGNKYKYQIKQLSDIVEYEEEIPNFKWKIFNRDTIEVLGYKSIRAETIYENNLYVAWFSLGLPINNGPFIYQGLPGLITKIQRPDLGYSYTLVGIKNKVVKSIEPKSTKIVKTTRNQLYKTCYGSCMEMFNNATFEDGFKRKFKEKLQKEFDKKIGYEF